MEALTSRMRVLEEASKASRSEFVRGCWGAEDGERVLERWCG